MLEPGRTAAIQRRFAQADIDEYIALGGGRPMGNEVPGALVCALFSYLLGVKLPGVGTNYLKQETEFMAPARVGEELTANVQITRVRAEKHLVDLATTCRDSDGTVLCRGRALVYVRDVADATEKNNGR